MRYELVVYILAAFAAGVFLGNGLMQKPRVDGEIKILVQRESPDGIESPVQISADWRSNVGNPVIHLQGEAKGWSIRDVSISGVCAETLFKRR